MSSKVGLIDFDINNIYSLVNLLNKMGITYQIIKHHKDIKNCKKLLLPGVGNFSTAIDKLYSLNLYDSLKDAIHSNIPILGICLGMQLFFETSEEGPGTKGLGVVRGNVKKIEISDNYTLPHIGWNEVNYEKSSSKLFENILDKSNFYFANSYCGVLSIKEKNVDVTYTHHGKTKFLSSIRKNNIYGVQFHPEKSQKVGMNLIRNFINL